MGLSGLVFQNETCLRWKKYFGNHRLFLAMFVSLASLVIFTSSSAAHTPLAEARNALRNALKKWLSVGEKPLAIGLGNRIKNAKKFKVENGVATYHFVFLMLTGFVIRYAKDEAKPITAFVSISDFDLLPKSPLGTLISHDLSPGMKLVAS